MANCEQTSARQSTNGTPIELVLYIYIYIYIYEKLILITRNYKKDIIKGLVSTINFKFYTIICNFKD